MARFAQTNKSISFIWIVWSTLYVYLWLKDEENGDYVLTSNWKKELYNWNPTTYQSEDSYRGAAYYKTHLPYVHHHKPLLIWSRSRL